MWINRFHVRTISLDMLESGVYTVDIYTEYTE